MRPMLTLLGAAVLAGCGGAPDVFIPDTRVPIANEPSLGTPRAHDKITQLDEPKVDVLWVIDNSGSMGEEQELVADNFSAFLRFFLESGLDWHMGLISTDTDDEASAGVLYQSGGHRYVSRETVGAEEVFGNMVNALGTFGSATERGFRAVDRFFDKLNRDNRGFYREEAAFHVIAISDEEEQSGDDPSQPEFIEMMRNLKPDPEMVTFSSIVGPAPSGCSGDYGSAGVGARYIFATENIGGMHESICEEDWVPVLRELGLQATGMRIEYFLSEAPVPGTIEVWLEVPNGDPDEGDYFVYDGVDKALLADGGNLVDYCPSGTCFTFEYNPVRNSIYMEGYVPPALSIVHIEYDIHSEDQPDFSFSLEDEQ